MVFELSPSRPAMGKSLSLKRFCRWAPRADRLRHSSAPQAQRWRAACGAGHLRIPIKHVKDMSRYDHFGCQRGIRINIWDRPTFTFTVEKATQRKSFDALWDHIQRCMLAKKKMARPWFLPRDSWLTLSSWPWEHWNISWLLLSNPWKVISHRGPSSLSLYEKKHILETIDHLLKWYCFYNVSPCHIFIWDNSLFSLLIFLMSILCSLLISFWIIQFLLVRVHDSP